jgi:DNA-binding MarR family transcriptional regulator
VLTTLYETGPITDRSGQATSRLAAVMGYTSRPVSLSPLLSLLEEDSLVRREVRGRRCFVIELTARGRALVDQDAGLVGRRIGAGDTDERPLWDGGWTSPSSSEPEPIRGRTAAAADGLEAPWELLRRELRDVLMEIGALQHRVTELERRL